MNLKLIVAILAIAVMSVCAQAVISADRAKRASSCRIRSSTPPSSYYAFS